MGVVLVPFPKHEKSERELREEMKMKAQDLTIGDWVIRRGHPEEKMRVLSIGWQERVLIELDLDGLVIKEFIDRIGSIPLTPEILEKNGFRKTYNGVYQLYLLLTNESALHILIGISSVRKWSVQIWGEKNDGNGNNEVISYRREWAVSLSVHELQHAFRLCGIDKEIVL